MTISDYLVFVGARLKDAEEKDDKGEMLRLIEVCVGALQDTAHKIMEPPR